MKALSKKARKICDENSPKGMCVGDECPLAKACGMKVGDTVDIWSDRVSLAAEDIKP